MALKKIGDWDRVHRLTNSLTKEMLVAQKLSLIRFGLKAEALAKTHMSKQDLNWTPLSVKYLARKVRSQSPRLSENILVATGSYFSAITTYVKRDTVYAGVRKEAKDKDGNNIANIAAVHEYGSRTGHIPKRPLWKPTFREVVAWHVKENRPEFHLIKALKKY